MSDFTIGHVADPKEGPMDGVYAETKGTYTKFKGTEGVKGKEAQFNPFGFNLIRQPDKN